jgi:FkbM family methyltransferase
MKRENLIRMAERFFPDFIVRLRKFKYEKSLPKEFISHLKKLDKFSIAIDIGANIGLVSEVIAKRGGRVIAFEPNKAAFEKLKLVALSYPNIEAMNEAAGVITRKVKLYHHKDIGKTSKDLSQASSLLNQKPNVSIENFEIVNEVDFSDFLDRLNEFVDLIKIDIEGYEIQLINYLLDKKKLQNVGVVYVELHDRKFKELIDSTNALKQRIKNEGYESKFFYNWH